MNGRLLRIRGVVQGVGFRYAMAEEARRLGVSGWVRNCRDGTVEALIQGDDEPIAHMLTWARRGPPGARVTHVEVEIGPPEAVSGFDLRPTL